MIDQELQKISNYKVESNAITIEDVEQTTGITRDFSVFALQKSLNVKQLKTSLSISKRLLESGENINVVIAVLFAHFRKLLTAATMKQKGNNINQIKEMMKLSDFQSRDIVTGMTNYTIVQIKSAIRLLHELDISVKTSAVSDIPGLQMVCYKICSN
jgi:DNA polymerase III delta subunit